jgi:hypothetical protein
VQTKIAFEKHESEQAKKYYNQFFNGVVFKSNSDTSVKVISGIELILKSE